MRIGVKEPRVRFTPNKPNFISLSEIPLEVIHFSLITPVRKELGS